MNQSSVLACRTLATVCLSGIERVYRITLHNPVDVTVTYDSVVVVMAFCLTFSPTRHINDSRRSSISVGSDVRLLLWA